VESHKHNLNKSCSSTRGKLWPIPPCILDGFFLWNIVMKNKELTQEYLKELLYYDKETGIFTKKVRPLCYFDAPKFCNTWNTRYANQECNTVHSNGYLVTGIDNKTYFLHRLAFLYVTGEIPSKGVDHIDGNKKNNTWSNLREATKSENAQNIKKAHKDNAQGLIGAYVDKRDGRFWSSIMIDGKNVHLGTFKSAQDANQAYLNAKRKIHEYCTI